MSLEFKLIKEKEILEKGVVGNQFSFMDLIDYIV